MIERMKLIGVALCCVASVAATAPERASAQPGATAEERRPARRFEGLYLGVEGGRQHVIGAGNVGGLDILEEDMRGVAEFLFGGRVQINRLVIGAEGGVGLTRAEGAIDIPANDLSIAFTQKGQHSIGGQIGAALGADRDWLVFAYVTETKRRFAVDIVQSGTAFQQRDKQGMLRFGGGVEHAVHGPLRVRLKGGTGRAKFDDVTSLDPPKRFEFSGAILFQF